MSQKVRGSELDSSEPYCQSEACTLHACLKKNTYAHEKCDRQLRSLYECCQRMYDRTQEKGESTACPMPQVVKRWMKDHPKK